MQNRHSTRVCTVGAEEEDYLSDGLPVDEKETISKQDHLRYSFIEDIDDNVEEDSYRNSPYQSIQRNTLRRSSQKEGLKVINPQQAEEKMIPFEINTEEQKEVKETALLDKGIGAPKIDLRLVNTPDVSDNEVGSPEVPFIDSISNATPLVKGGYAMDQKEEAEVSGEAAEKSTQNHKEVQNNQNFDNIKGEEDEIPVINVPNEGDQDANSGAQQKLKQIKSVQQPEQQDIALQKLVCDPSSDDLVSIPYIRLF